jgi:DNA-binding NtrC family response regulator
VGVRKPKDLGLEYAGLCALDDMDYAATPLSGFLTPGRPVDLDLQCGLVFCGEPRKTPSHPMKATRDRLADVARSVKKHFERAYVRGECNITDGVRRFLQWCATAEEADGFRPLWENYANALATTALEVLWGFGRLVETNNSQSLCNAVDACHHALVMSGLSHQRIEVPRTALADFVRNLSSPPDNFGAKLVGAGAAGDFLYVTGWHGLRSQLGAAIERTYDEAMERLNYSVWLDYDSWLDGTESAGVEWAAWDGKLLMEFSGFAKTPQDAGPDAAVPGKPKVKSVQKARSQAGETLEAQIESGFRAKQEILELLQKRKQTHTLIGESRAIMLVWKKIKEMTGSESCFLLYGERGTGKDTVAQIVHYASPRHGEPCLFIGSDVPDTLAEGELGGHEPGAYTGAEERAEGRIRAADKGTVVINDIQTLSKKMQTVLRECIAKKQVRPVGHDGEPIPVDIRFCAATNVPPAVLRDKDLVLPDFLDRITGAFIEIPPLRERMEDIPELAKYFTHRDEDRCEAIEEKAIQYLIHVEWPDGMEPWPGNIRQLRNIIKRAATKTDKRDTIRLDAVREAFEEELRKETLGKEGIQHDPDAQQRKLGDIDDDRFISVHEACGGANATLNAIRKALNVPQGEDAVRKRLEEMNLPYRTRRRKKNAS